ncbi:hypothetical protein ACF0H5_021479 [Mactra antiquata]
MVGALWFIGVLLVMSGVERNPGPFVEEFNFRYQYLLIEVGTKVIRKVFDDIVGPDLYTFLTNHHAHLQLLIRRKMITCNQENLLPPIEPSPSSENFDITLLCCLLRNICGLCPPGDNVWIQPATTDKSLEANITRLRLCRNNVAHRGSIVEDKTKLEDKWTELCDILNELGKVCGFTDLPTRMKRAETIVIDEHLQKRFDSALELWDDMENMIDHGLGEVIRGQGAINKDHMLLIKCQKEINEGQVEIRTDQEKIIMDQGEIIKHQRDIIMSQGEISKELKQIKNKLENPEPAHKRRRLNDKSDIRQKLIDIYEQEFDTLPMCAFLRNETCQILKMYQLPLMKVEDYHKVEKHQIEQSHVNHAKVETCCDLFCNGDKQCKHIYLTGDAGVGKTSFSRLIAYLWCNSKLGKLLETDKLQAYAVYLARFEFVFHVNLRYTDDVNVISMIVNQLSPYLSDDKRDNLYGVIEQILNDQESLVIMDGLDEWIPKLGEKRKIQLPIKPKSSKCVYFTTCRPYKIENVRLSRTDIDHQVKMIGFDEIAIDAYVSILIDYINTNYNDNKNSDDFMKTVEHVGLTNLLHIPIITSHLVMLWIDRPLTSMSRSLIYGNIFDMLFKIAHDREIVIPSQTSSNLKFPNSFSELNYLKNNFSNVEKLCSLSYRLLFEHDENIAGLVFSREQLVSEPYCLSDSETNWFCTVGLLSKSQVFRKFGKQELRLSFLHKSYLEFLAAVYVSTFETSKVLNIFNTCRTINDVLKLKHFLIFYAGLSTVNMNSLMYKVYSLISADIISSRATASSLLYQYMKMILTCYVEGSCRMTNPIPLEDYIFKDRFYIVISPFVGDVTYDKEYETKLLKNLLCFNGSIVKYLEIRSDEYHAEFDKITHLQWLRISWSHNASYHAKFNDLMLQNKSSLHSVHIEGKFFEGSLLSELPVDHLHNLTSLSLEYLLLSHQCLHCTINFICKNITLKHIRLAYVHCDEHQGNIDKCALPCDFSNYGDLETLVLSNTNVLCSKVNVSSLKEIKLSPLSQNIAYHYGDLFHCIQHSPKLTYINIDGNNMLNRQTVSHLIYSIQFLSNIKTMLLSFMKIPNNVHSTLHPNVTQVNIQFLNVTMSDTWFKYFFESCTREQCHNTGNINYCIIRQTDGDNYTEMSPEESVDFMYNYFKSMSTVSIKEKASCGIHVSFETNCQ